jgi:hypothetical protein
MKISIPKPPPVPDEWELVLKRTTPGPSYSISTGYRGTDIYPERLATVDDLIAIIKELPPDERAKIWNALQ